MKQSPRWSVGRLMVLGLCVLACGSCGTTAREGRGSSYLVIDELEASSGSEATKFANVLRSDVVTKCSIYQDNGQVTLRMSMKDPTNPAGATPVNEITVTHYHVDFVRADGRNTPGVDVPYGFDGGMTGTVKAGTSLTLLFTLVRAQAKLEPPLAGLAFKYDSACKVAGPSGGAMLVSTLAQLTIYGHDQAGNQVSVSGTISVEFADWADPTTVG